jgi:hypothetical protein
MKGPQVGDQRDHLPLLQPCLTFFFIQSYFNQAGTHVSGQRTHVGTLIWSSHHRKGVVLENLIHVLISKPGNMLRFTRQNRAMEGMRVPIVPWRILLIFRPCHDWVRVEHICNILISNSCNHVLIRL